MRKRNLSFCIDNIIWAIIAMLPILCFIVSYTAYDLSTVESLPTFAEFFQDNFALLSNNFIYTGFVEIFGSNGVMPLIDTTSINSLLMFLSYFVIVDIIHLAVDLLLLLPRISHKFMHKIGGDE